MYRNTRFQELMEGLPRNQFQTLVDKLEADKYNKGFTRWNQLVSMIFAQVSGSKSLRVLESRFNSQKHHHYHLNTRSIKRSTLADANKNKDSLLFKMLCEGLLSQAHRRIKKECKEMLYLLDSTSLTLKGHGYDQWTLSNKTQFTQGLKIHMLYAPQQQKPVYSHITTPNVNDIEDARKLPIEANATYVFDKGYYDYNWWHDIDQQDAYFVTRFKRNAALGVVKQNPIDPKSKHLVLEDALVIFTNKNPGAGRKNNYKKPIRRVTVRREDKSTPIVLVTNDLKRSASEIASLYKSRWDIELFFKWLKQNLKIKTFIGRSENAVRTQIYIALITYLLVGIYQKKQVGVISLTTFLSILTVTLFQRKETKYQHYKRRKEKIREFLDRQVILPL